ncbi:MAG TPA: periplasmic heavy metal sensor [Xanthobacteraceae bacterium]
MSGLLSFRSWREPLLLGSLCCNVLLATYIGIQWLKADNFLVEALGPARLIARVADRLPKQDAEILWQVYRSKAPEFSTAEADYVRGLGRPVDLLTAETVDTEALRTAVMESRKNRLRVGDLIVETFVDAAVQMSADGRRQLVSGIPR